EERLAPLDEVPDRGKALSHDAREDGFDADLDPGLDGADGEGLVDQGPADHRHSLGPFLLAAAQPPGGSHGAQTEDGDHGGEDDDRAALPIETASRPGASRPRVPGAGPAVCAAPRGSPAP